MGDFDQIVNSWLGQFSKGQVPMKAEARIEALTELFERFKKENFEKAYFTSFVKGKIITKCINPNHPDKKKRRKWAEYVAFHLDIAFHSVFTQAVAQEENPLASPTIQDVAEIDIEAQVADHNVSVLSPDIHGNTIYKEPRKQRIEVHADTPVEESILTKVKSDNVICPEMAALMGIKIK